MTNTQNGAINIRHSESIFQNNKIRNSSQSICFDTSIDLFAERIESSLHLFSLLNELVFCDGHSFGWWSFKGLWYTAIPSTKWLIDKIHVIASQ